MPSSMGLSARASGHHSLNRITEAITVSPGKVRGTTMQVNSVHGRQAQSLTVTPSTQNDVHGFSA